MAEAVSRPPRAEHVLIKISSAKIGVGVDFSKRPSISQVELWTDPGKPGLSTRQHFENGGSIELHYPTKVAKPLLRTLLEMIASLDREFRADVQRKARQARNQRRPLRTFTCL